MDRMVRLITEDCVRVGNNLYFIEKNYNIVFKLEISTGTISIVDSLPEEKMLGKRLGFKVLSYGDYLYFAPMSAKKIWRYSISERTWKSYELKYIDEYEAPYNLIMAGLSDNKLFFAGGNYPAIVVLNLETEKLDYIEEPLKTREELKIESKDGFFRTNYVLLENTIYMASCLKNEVLKLDLDTYDHEYITVGDPGFRYSGIAYDGKDFFLAPRKKTPAVIWDGGSKVEMIKLQHNEKNDALTTLGVLCKDDKVIMGSWFIDESFILEKTNDKYNSRLFNECFWFYNRIDDDTYVRLLNTGIMKIECRNTLYQYNLQFDYAQMVEWIVKEMKRRGEKIEGIPQDPNLIMEKDDIDLSVFIGLM